MKRILFLLFLLSTAINGAVIFGIDVGYGTPWPVASVAAPICAVAAFGMMMILVVQSRYSRQEGENHVDARASRSDRTTNHCD